MGGETVSVEALGLADAVAVINHLGSDDLRVEALSSVGGQIVSQTQERFNTRLSPDGAPWAPWSAAHRKTRTSAHSLLVQGGDLRETIHWVVEGEELRVGSELPYAAIQQFGGRGIPARPYLGVSAENAQEITSTVIDVFGAVLP